MDSSIYFLWKGKTQKTMETGKRKRGRDHPSFMQLDSIHQEVQAKFRIASHSSSENPSMSSCPNLMSVISLIMPTLQMSSSWILSASISSISVSLISSSFTFLVNSRILLMLLPVIDRVSFSIMFKSCLGRNFFDFLICLRKDKNLLITSFYNVQVAGHRFHQISVSVDRQFKHSSNRHIPCVLQHFGFLRE